MIYLDHSATTPLSPRVLEAMMPWLTTEYGNASSVHATGRKARVAIEEARTEIAHAIGAHPAELVFTSGGTESNNTILGSARYESALVDAVYCSATEHHSVLDVIHAMKVKGAMADLIGVDATGRVDPTHLATFNLPRTLVSVMHVNNETGVVQDIAGIRSATPDAYLHTDAVQALGKIRLDMTSVGVDFATISGHKINGPKGVGAMFIRKGIDFKPTAIGGGQERNRRAGTENVAAIVGFQHAVQHAMAEFENRVAAMSALRELLRERITALVPNVRINTPQDGCAPHILNISFPDAANFDGEAVLQLMDMQSVAVSNGSACVSGSMQPSHVLQAMGLGIAESKAGVRFSVGPDTPSNDVTEAVTILANVIRTLRV